MDNSNLCRSLFLIFLLSGLALAPSAAPNAAPNADAPAPDADAATSAELVSWQHELAIAADELRRLRGSAELGERPRSTQAALTRLAEHLRHLEKRHQKSAQARRPHDADGAARGRLEQKRRTLLRLAEQAARSPARAESDSFEPAGARISPAASELPGAGAHCGTAIPLELGQRARLEAGTAAWVTFVAPEEGIFSFHTLGSEGDTRVRLYRRCGHPAADTGAAGEHGPESGNDDHHGLLAAVGFHAAALDRVWARVEPGQGTAFVGVDPAGSLSGTVRDSDGNAQAQAGVVLLDRNGNYEGQTVADDMGAYTFFEVAPDFYYVVTDLWGTDTLLDSAYPDISCPGSGYSGCDLDAATLVQIEAGTASTGIDIEVFRGATVSGRVTVSGAGTAIEGSGIRLFDPFGSFLGSDTTDPAGRYSIGALVAGSYRVVAEDERFRNEVWDDQPCVGDCQPIDGDPVVVPAEGAVAGIDFDLDLLGSIRAELVDAASGEPVSSAEAWVYASDGSLLSQDHVDDDLLLGGLESGTYFLVVRSYAHVGALWSGLDCPEDCDVTAGTPIVVVEGETTELGEIQLRPRGSISGRVTSNPDGSSLWARLDLHTADGTWLDSTTASSSDGVYEFDRVIPGSYRVVVDWVDFHQREVWNDRPCPNDICDVSAGDAVVVTSGSDTAGIDFGLDRLGTISGTVSDSLGGVPPESVRVHAYDGAGQVQRTAYTAEDGSYELLGLAAGNYFVTTASDRYVDEAWEDIECEGFTCDPTTGQAVAVTANTDRTGIDFALDRRPAIAGRVVEAGSGLPVPGASVRVYDSSGHWVDRGTADDMGFYEILDLDMATYYLQAEGDDRHANVLFDDQVCNRPCDPLAGDPLALGAGGATVDFALPVGGRIEGTVSALAAGPTPRGQVRIYDTLGSVVREAWIDPDGSFALEGLAGGTYHAVAKPSGIWVAQEWGGDDCDQPTLDPCDPLAGDPIVVSLGTVVTGIDFALSKLGSISGQIFDARTGAQLLGGRVELYDAAGTFVDSRFVGSFGEGRFAFDQTPPGTYYLATAGHEGYRDQVLGGEPCEPDFCDATTGTALVVDFEVAIGPLRLELEPGPGVSVRLVRADSGAPVVGAAIDLWRTPDQPFRTLATDVDGRATTVLGAGGYALSTDAGQGLVDQVWEGVSCPDGPAFGGFCDPFSGALLLMAEGDGLTELVIELEGEGGLFADGFESGSTADWSSASGR